MDTTIIKDWDAFLRGFTAAKRGDHLSARQGADWQAGWHMFHFYTSSAANPCSDRVGALH